MKRDWSQSRWALNLGVMILLTAHYALAVSSVRLKSPTCDEVPHITAGCAYWRLNDYRLQPENGNLTQRIAALPVAFSRRFAFPRLDQLPWRASSVWDIGEQFFHGNGNDLEAMLMRSRAVMALLSAGNCLVVFLWSRSLFGARGGIVSLVLASFSPLLVAHGRLATSDTAASLFFLLTMRSLFGLFRKPSAGRALGCASSLACLALTKTSVVLIVPMAALLAVTTIVCAGGTKLPGNPGGVRAAHPASVRTAALLFCLLFSWAAVWAAYGFRYEPYPAGKEGTFEQYYDWGLPLGTLPSAARLAGLPGKAVAFAGEHRLLPEAFLYGTAYVFSTMKRYSFLNGRYAATGQKAFFPYCFLVKSTLPALLLLAVALVRFARGRAWMCEGEGPRAARRRMLCETSPLWALLAVYWTSLIFSPMNIGARHMLPVYSASFVLAGVLGFPWAVRNLRIWVVLLLLWHVGEGIRAYPHYLAYFNQITGRKAAYRHLVDSNLDWGQDLPGLKRWLHRRFSKGPPSAVYLYYFGNGSPSYYGIAAEPLPLEERALEGLSPATGEGIYCVSATSLQAVYYLLHGRWNDRYEEEYQTLRRRFGPPRAAGVSPGEERALEARGRYWQLGTARLLAYLRHRPPDDEVGFSILVYELDEDDLAAAFDGPPVETGPQEVY